MLAQNCHTAEVDISSFTNNLYIFSVRNTLSQPHVCPPASEHGSPWLAALFALLIVITLVVISTPAANLPDKQTGFSDQISTIEQPGSGILLEHNTTSDDVAALLPPVLALNQSHQNGAYPALPLPALQAEFSPGSRPPDLA